MAIAWSGAVRAAILGYLVGALPTAVFFGWLQRKNVLAEGSGNPGALNAFRVLGAVPGLMVLALDLAKGFLAVAMGEALGGYPGALAAGAAAVWGHAYSPYLLFRGGKGIAPALGVLLAVSPWLAGIALAVFALFYLAGRRPYRAALTAAMVFPLVAYAYGGRAELFFFGLLLALPLVLRQWKDRNR